MAPKPKTPTAPSLSDRSDKLGDRDFTAELQTVDVETERRKRQRAEAVSAAETARRQRAEAHAQRDALRLSALADGDDAARERYAQACDDVRAFDDQADEADRLIEQLDGKLRRLASERRVVEEAKALAEIDQIGQQILDQLAHGDQHVTALADILAAVVNLKRVQARTADFAGLALSQKRFSMVAILRVLRSKLGHLIPIEGQRHHAFDGLSLVDAEGMVQGFADASALDDDDAPADRPAIDAAELAEVLAAAPRSVVQH